MEKIKHKKRHGVKITLVRDHADTYLKFWIAPEVEAVFKSMAEKEHGLDNNIETSTRWLDDNKAGLQFYRNSSELKQIVDDSYPRVQNDVGSGLMSGDKYPNVGLLRIVGASEGSGKIIRTTDLIGYEESKIYVDRLASWVKNFYRDYIQKTKIVATISFEI